MLLTEAMKRIKTGMIYRKRVDGDVVKVILKDGQVTRVLINDVAVDRGAGAEGNISVGLEDLLFDDWEVTQGY